MSTNWEIEVREKRVGKVPKQVRHEAVLAPSPLLFPMTYIGVVSLELHFFFVNKSVAILLESPFHNAHAATSVQS